ncbi:MAG: hypothetical protein ACREJD_03055 [Phycisphaerales bacterium]
MPDKLLDKYQRMVSKTSSSDRAGEQTEQIVDHGCYGFLRGVRDRAIMLELRKKDGRILAVAYGSIERVEFDPDSGITLTGGGKRLQIEGQQLAGDIQSASSLLAGIIRHRVSWIRESPSTLTINVASDLCIIERIDWE